MVVGNGHSPEHACLYCRDLRLLISGDQVLPKISSNVSVQAIEPDANPLADWMQSLSRIADRVPDDVLVLPAHKSPFRGLHARIRELLEAHRSALTRLEIVLERKRVIDLFGVLFSRPITAELIHMATGETIAHLASIRWQTGRATREQDANGVWWWRRPGHIDQGRPKPVAG